MTQRQINMAAAAVSLVMRPEVEADGHYTSAWSAQIDLETLAEELGNAITISGNIRDREIVRKSLTEIATAALAALYDLHLFPGPDDEKGGPAGAELP